MLLRNVCPLDADLTVPELGERLVEHGQAVEVHDPDVATRMLASSWWEAVDDQAKAAQQTADSWLDPEPAPDVAEAVLVTASDGTLVAVTGLRANASDAAKLAAADAAVAGLVVDTTSTDVNGQPLTAPADPETDPDPAPEPAPKKTAPAADTTKES